MNKLPLQKRTQILSMLVEDMSMRVVARAADVSRNNMVDKLLGDVGVAFQEYQDATLPNLRCQRIPCDEIWSFCYQRPLAVRSLRYREDFHSPVP